ncbi:integral membrane protein [Colletotrichum asianum]
MSLPPISSISPASTTSPAQHHNPQRQNQQGPHAVSTAVPSQSPQSQFNDGPSPASQNHHSPPPPPLPVNTRPAKNHEVVPADAQYITGEPYHYQPFGPSNVVQAETSTSSPALSPEAVAPADRQQTSYPPPPPTPQKIPLEDGNPDNGQSNFNDAVAVPAIPESAASLKLIHNLPLRPAPAPSEQRPEAKDSPLPGQQQPTSNTERVHPRQENASFQSSPTRTHPSKSPEDPALDGWRRAVPIPVFSENGKPNDIMWDCPESRVVDYETDWYHLPDIPNFTICTCCYDMYLAATPLSDSFKRVRRPRGACGLKAHRVTKVLIPQYLRTLDPQRLRDYMTKRLSIQDCHGVGGVKGTAGVKWFKPLDTRLNGFLSCEACFEEVILGTAFHHNWAPYDSTQAEDDVWACDICIPYIGRILINYSWTRTWEDWIQSTIKYLNLPRCEKELAVSQFSRKWVRLSGGRVPNLKVCEKCFDENLASTPLGYEFEFIPVEPITKEPNWMEVALGHRLQESESWLCSVTNNFPLAAAISMAKDLKNIDALVIAAETILANAPCTEKGTSQDTWYTLASGNAPEDFRICPACHAAWVSPLKLDRFYEVARGVDPTKPFVCSLHPSNPRWTEHIHRWQEALETGVWSRYSNWVRMFADVPPCAGDGKITNGKWYGWDDCTICPECWMTFCKDAHPAASSLPMDYHKQIVPDTRMCCIYSPRMRQKWVEACEVGNAGRLVEFSRTRIQMYIQTVVEIRRLRVVHETQVVQSMNAGTQSAVWGNMQSARVLFGTNNGYEHGNSTLGWHATTEGVTSAAYQREMNGLRDQSWGTLIQIEHLQNQWKMFE